MSLDIALVLAVACVWLALATNRVVADLPGLAVDIGGDDVSDELIHALERGLMGFRRWVLAAPFCWLVAAWASNHGAGALAAESLAFVAQFAGLIPVFGVLLSIGAGLWRFSAATSAWAVEGGGEIAARDVSAAVLAGMSALAFGLAFGSAALWLRHVM